MKGNNCCSSKLSICNLGAAIGMVSGLFMFALALCGMWFQVGHPLMEIYSSIYMGYDITFMGAIIGLIWGFVVGYIFGGLVAFFYNFFHCVCPCGFCKSGRKKEASCCK